MIRPQALLATVRASFWFVPAVMVLLSLLVAVVLVELDSSHGWELSQFSPRLFGAGADGSRALLSAIATSMVTVAGVVFSITVVVLSQASAQYSPRVLRNFMRDRPTQLVLGVFVGAFAYCVVVLRTVRAGEGGEEFIPSLGVLGAAVYAMAAIAMLIFFVHHVAQGIQAASIVERIAEDTRAAIDHLFPQEVGEPARTPGRLPEPAGWCEVRSKHTGYVVAIDSQQLQDLACGSGRLLRLRVRVGDFVPDGSVVLEAAGTSPLEARLAGQLREAVVLGVQRTTDQDAGFGLQQLVDVALKALSPGINDPSTAMLCIDRLGALLARLAGRETPDPHRVVDGQVRLIASGSGFEQLLGEVVQPLLASARGDVRVLARIAWLLGHVAGAARDPGRRAAVRSLARDLRREARAVRPRWRATELGAQVRALLRELDRGA